MTGTEAPKGAFWRASTLPHLIRARVWVLEGADGSQIGSVAPARGGKWQNRDTGEEFATADEAKASVEKYIK